jgi:hypothetical protein
MHGFDFFEGRKPAAGDALRKIPGAPPGGAGLDPDHARLLQGCVPQRSPALCDSIMVPPGSGCRWSRRAMGLNKSVFQDCWFFQ